jgi:F-box interacting protein
MEPCDKRIKDAPPNGYAHPTSTFISNFGFGFDPKTNDYKVVRILSFLILICEVVVYSLSTNSWRVIDSSPNPSYLIRLPRYPSYLNGVHHWWAEDDDIEVLTMTTDACFPLI